MRVWWLPVTAALSVLPLLLAGYIRDPVYPAGYLPAPTSSTPSYPARYLASKTGYKASKTGYKASRTGYEATSTTRRPSRSTTTRRLTYERIYWEGDHWRPSSGGDSQWRPSERRPSSSGDRSGRGGDRSGRGGQLSYTGHPAAVDRAGVVAQDRSDTYHTGNGDVCGDFQTIGLGASAASLLAFLVYILLTNSLTSTVSTTRGFTSSRSAEDGVGAPSWTTRATVTATCAAAQMLERRSAHVEPARHAKTSGQSTMETSTSLTQRRRGSSEFGALGVGGLPVGSPPVGGPTAVGRQFGDDCFSEMIGALAGLAGLGALSGFSLSQSAQALLASMMTISALTSSSSTTTTTTTTTSGNTTTTTRRRSLEDDDDSEELGVGLVRQMASLVLVPGEPSCVRHQLCRLVRRARHSGPPYDTALPLASLPLSWLVSKRTGQPFSDLCWVIPEAMSDRDCGRIQPGCS